jgi:cellulose synthase/poly-beta-1,6-N-acetylglucosamine synthase-like glycosyltransferase
VIIQIVSNLFEEGYLERDGCSLISPFFAGGNVAFRREALLGVGSYDSNCITGEDHDMCLRISRAGWDLYFEPRAGVRHKNRLTLRSLARQWFGYGYHHPYLVRKHTPKGLRFYRLGRDASSGSVYRLLVKTLFPFHVSVFLTPYLTMHLMLALAIVLAVAGLHTPAIVAGVLVVAEGIRVFRSDFRARDPVLSGKFILFRYLANLALIAGGLLGGAKSRMLYINATFDHRG